MNSISKKTVAMLLLDLEQDLCMATVKDNAFGDTLYDLGYKLGTCEQKISTAQRRIEAFRKKYVEEIDKKEILDELI